MRPKSEPGLFRKLFAVLTVRERRRMFIQLLLALIGVGLETLGVGIIVPTLVLLTQQDPGSRFPAVQPFLDYLGNPSQSELIVIGMLALASVYLVKTTFLAFLAWTQVQFSFGIRTRLSQDLFALYLRQPFAFHLQHNTAYLMRNANMETAQLVQSALLPLMTMAGDLLLFAALGALLLFIEPVGALTVVGVIGSVAWLFLAVTRRRLTNWGIQRREHEGHRMLHLRQGLASVKEIQLLGREQEFLRRYRVHNRRAAIAQRNERTMNRLPRLAFELLGVLGLVVLVLAMVAQGRDMARVLPVLGAFAVAAFRMLPSMTRLVSSAQQLRFAQPIVDSVYEELKLDTAETRVIGAPGSGARFERDIRLVDVTYAYEGSSARALDRFSITIHRGECVGLIGPSGSGKSTAVHVLLGLLPPSSGQTLLDGVDFHRDLRRWQDQIGYVSQEIYLTDDTLRRNVAYGIPEKEIDDAAIDKAIEAAQLQDFIATLPSGSDTLVGEHGARLSGGQRQRVGIARALYHDPSVLVLDEATSALDTDTEKEVMQAVNALHGEKTIVIIAHRLSTVEKCDRLYRMSEGRVVEEGPPSVVLKSKASAG